MRAERGPRQSGFQRYRRLLAGVDDDPLGGVANLFDVAMVFAVALILALFTALQVPELLLSEDDFTVIKNPGSPNMEIITKQGQQIERLKMTDQSLQGQGQRLGIAYRLASGEVVYVPDAPGPGDRPAAPPAP